VIWLFLRRGTVQPGVGLAIGIVGAFGVGRLQALLVQTSPRPEWIRCARSGTSEFDCR
jgi:hypothetical protein